MARELRLRAQPASTRATTCASSWPAPNFGTGSSREHAPWALEDYGFDAVISPRFADIFRNNCLKIGLCRWSCPRTWSTRIMRAVEDDPTLEIVIDVVDRRVAVPAIDLDEPFELDDFHHYRLLKGLDDIGLTLQHDDEHRRLTKPPAPPGCRSSTPRL